MLKLDNIFDAARGGSFFVPHGMVITGTFTADKPGKIAGTIHGDVFVTGKVTILKEAVIRGDIHASGVTVCGRVTGEIKCTGKTVLESGAHVRGNISTVEIVVEKDTILEGIITKAAGEIPYNEETEDGISQENVTSGIAPKKQSLTDENASSESWF
ncbi:MAG: polymer-forming cytoskeletal protein [Ginsengibacter sp.]